MSARIRVTTQVHVKRHTDNPDDPLAIACPVCNVKRSHPCKFDTLGTGVEVGFGESPDYGDPASERPPGRDPDLERFALPPLPRPRIHRARGITGIAIRCPQCGAPVGQGCDFGVSDDPEPDVHPQRRVGRLAVACRWCGARPGEPCVFPTAPVPGHHPHAEPEPDPPTEPAPIVVRPPADDLMRVRTVCSCGASLDVSGTPEHVQAIRDVFAAFHPSPGHTRTPPPRQED